MTTDSGESKLHQMLEALPRPLHVLYRTYAKSSEDRAFDLAAAIAYYWFFSIFPLFLGLTALSGYFIDSAEARQAIYSMLTETLPGDTSDFVLENLETVVKLRGPMGFVSIVTLLWSASRAIGAVSRAVNLAWGTPAERFFVFTKLRYFGLTVVAILLILGSMAATAMLEIYVKLDTSFFDRVLGSDIAARIYGIATSTTLIFVTVLLIYKAVANEPVRARQLWRGALLAAVLFEACKAGFVIYLDRLASHSVVYGSLASIIVLLMWLYLSSYILIFGAELNVVLDSSEDDEA